MVSLISAIQLLTTLISSLKALADFIQANKDEAWFKDCASTFKGIKDTINDPKLTEEDRTTKLRAAGNNIRDILNRM